MSIAKTAAGKPQAADSKIIQTRVASAWTLSKTMLPAAPAAEQLKFARNLLSNSTVALTAALRQTAINAHWTRVATELAKVRKVDMNDLLEDPSVLNKETKAVTQELRGEPKAAAGKVADDRKDAGPVPAQYPEPKRTEPTELDGGHAADRPDLEKASTEKEAAVKTACKDGKDCKGCKNCKEKKDKDKKASVKVAEEGEPEKKEDEAPAKAEGEEAADEAAAEGAEDAAEGAEGVAEEEKAEEAGDADEAAEGDDPAGEGETFDPEKTNLEEIAADIEQDNQRLQDAIAELENAPDAMTMGDDDDGALGDDLMGDEFPADGQFGDEGDLGDEQVPDENGKELDLDEIFNQDRMSDKVSALNDEDDHEAAVEDFEDFFAPSDPSELENVLEQEEGLSSPADMFRLDGVEDDPMGFLLEEETLREPKMASAGSEGIVEPGSLMDHFETSHGSDNRDADNDHEGTIADDVFNSLKQPSRDEHRDTEANLKTPPAGNKEASGKKKVASGPIRRLRPSHAKTASGPSNLASLLFLDDSDFQ